MTQGSARLLLLLLGCVVLPACARTPQPLPSRHSAESAMTAIDKDVSSPRQESRSHAYTDDPVEAHLGPHVYRIPANYFRDQMGPNFDGSFSLMVQWPDLQPLPPGARRGQDMETFDKQVTIAPYYTDRVPIETFLEQRTRFPVAEDSLTYQDPRKRLDLMDAKEAMFGLTPYRVNLDRLAEHAKREEAYYGYPSRTGPETYKDWYVARDAQGGLATLIKCDPREMQDGLVIQGDRVLAEGPHRISTCTHEFVIAEDQITVSMDYVRIFLKDWKRIEDRARGLLARYRVR